MVFSNKTIEHIKKKSSLSFDRASDFSTQAALMSINISYIIFMEAAIYCIHNSQGLPFGRNDNLKCNHSIKITNLNHRANRRRTLLEGEVSALKYKLKEVNGDTEPKEIDNRTSIIQLDTWKIKLDEKCKEVVELKEESVFLL